MKKAKYSLKTTQDKIDFASFICGLPYEVVLITPMKEVRQKIKQHKMTAGDYLKWEALVKSHNQPQTLLVKIKKWFKK